MKVKVGGWVGGWVVAQGNCGPEVHWHLSAVKANPVVVIGAGPPGHLLGGFRPSRLAERRAAAGRYSMTLWHGHLDGAVSCGDRSARQVLRRG